MCALCWLGPFLRVGWFWRSVCSPPPWRCSVRLPVVGVRFFLPLAFQGRPGFGWVCVCVSNIWTDEKPLSFRTACWCRGAVNLIPSTAQRRRWFEIEISGLIIPTYLQSVSISRHGMWLTQEPQLYLTSTILFSCSFGIQFPTDHFSDSVLF